jgi:hypothetical protein
MRPEEIRIRLKKNYHEMDLPPPVPPLPHPSYSRIYKIIETCRNSPAVLTHSSMVEEEEVCEADTRIDDEHMELGTSECVSSAEEDETLSISFDGSYGYYPPTTQQAAVSRIPRYTTYLNMNRVHVGTQSIFYKNNQVENGCDWSGRFFKLVDEIKSMNAGTSFHNRIRINEELMRLSRDFLLSAELYGKTIISEIFLDPSEKTIKVK